MKRIFLLVSVVMLSVGAYAQQNQSTQKYIEVNAIAEREVNPDEIFLNITLDESDSKSKQTITQLENNMYKALKGAGVDVEKALEVSNMASNLKEYLLKRNDGQTIKQYVLKVSNQQLTPVFKALDDAGIYKVSVRNTRYSKAKELYNELLGEAAVIAKTRAGVLASAVGQKAGKAIFMQSYDNSNNYVYQDNTVMVRGLAKSATEMESTPTFEFKKIKISVTIQTRFEIE